MARLRLGLDIGTNSLGWALLTVDRDGWPTGLVDLGVRIYADGRDPQSGATLAEDRRLARAARRRRDRQMRRKARLMRAFIDLGLMPADPAARKRLERLDPYHLRARGLDERLSLHELGRALFHIHQRRGFLSNRKTDRKDKEAGKIQVGREALARLIEESGSRTVGEYLHKRRQSGLSVRARLQGEGANASYEFYFDRDLARREVEALWRKQAEFHPDLTDAAFARLTDAIMFYQAPLKTPDVGRCTLIPAEERAPRALPVFQRFRLLEELANLRILGEDHRLRPLTLEQRDDLLEALASRQKMTFAQLHKRLRLRPEERFSLESDTRKDIKGDETAAVLAKPKCFGKRWLALPPEVQEEVVLFLLTTENEEEAIAGLMERWGLDRARAEAVSAASLPDGYGRLGRTALTRLVEVMEAGVDPETGEVLEAPLTYDRAVKALGLHHSDLRPEGGVPRLPYYGQVLERHVVGSGRAADRREDRFGRFPNPTVHIALNQVQRVVNAIIAAHGKPDEIVVELSRELKLSEKKKKDVRKIQAENRAKNEKRREKLAELGVADNGENRMRLRLWEELHPEPHRRRCVYTGQQMAAADLFSGQVHIDHILPFSKTLDNSVANRIVCFADANAAKGNRAPCDAFGHSPVLNGRAYNWAEIQERAAGLPKNKRWRFAADAMNRFEDQDFEGLGLEREDTELLATGFLARHLTDGQYIARIAREYLLHLYPRAEQSRVWTVPGTLTGLLRDKWGLNRLLASDNVVPPESAEDRDVKARARERKNRADHRHHAVDAVVIALTDRGMLNEVARRAGAAEAHGHRLVEGMPEPWTGYLDAVREKLARLVVSHKVDRSASGKLLDETAYGFVPDPAKEQGANLLYRKPFLALNENEVARIRNTGLRKRVQRAVAEAKAAGGTLRDALERVAAEGMGGASGAIRRVRLVKKGDGAVPIRGGDGRAFKAYLPTENHRLEIYETADGVWRGEGVTLYDANRPDYRPTWREAHPDARLIMCLHKGDLIDLEVEGERRIVKVVRLEPSANRVRVVAHHEGGDFAKRHADPADPFAWRGWRLCSFSRMKEAGARPVRVDVLGRVHAG